jgi:hypothetical protein
MTLPAAQLPRLGNGTWLTLVALAGLAICPIVAGQRSDAADSKEEERAVAAVKKLGGTVERVEDPATAGAGLPRGGAGGRRAAGRAGCGSLGPGASVFPDLFLPLRAPAFRRRGHPMDLVNRHRFAVFDRRGDYQAQVQETRAAT